jgi:NAD(P)-dependent dehydrogenase (short-subunit alcohol dehydrogenase family)
MKDTVHLILGATGGIGGALARRLRDAGARPVLAARGEERLAALGRDLDAPVRALDARSFDAVSDAASAVKAECGRLDGIANCVGSFLLKPAHATTEAELSEALDQNVKTAFAAVRAAALTMRGTGGSVVLMSSAAAAVGLRNHEAIAAAKGAVSGLALAAAATCSGAGIRVNVVSPGLTRTPLVTRVTENESIRRASESMHALGRIGEPEEVASAIAWFLDPAQSWVTGQILGVDGGLASVRPARG